MKRIILLSLLAAVCPISLSAETLGDAISRHGDRARENRPRVEIAEMYNLVIRDTVLADKDLIAELKKVYPDVTHTLEKMRIRKSRNKEPHYKNMKLLEVVIDLMNIGQIQGFDEKTRIKLFNIKEMYIKKRQALARL